MRSVVDGELKSHTRHASRMPMQGVGMIHIVDHVSMHLSIWTPPLRHEALRIGIATVVWKRAGSLTEPDDSLLLLLMVDGRADDSDALRQ